MAAQPRDQRLQDHQKRLDELMDSAREGVERQATEVLDRLAATARNIAQRFETMARDARQRAAEKEATPGYPGASERAPEPQDAPPASSGESGNAGA
jgi:RNase P subunit RPR2